MGVGQQLQNESRGASVPQKRDDKKTKRHRADNSLVTHTKRAAGRTMLCEETKALTKDWDKD
jgi:hypothetical protein